MSTKTTSITWIETHIQSLLNPFQRIQSNTFWTDLKFSFHPLRSSHINNYRLKLSMRYAKEIVTWELCFNPLYPELGPDIFLKEEKYMEIENLCDIFEKSSCLVNWNLKIDSSLLNVTKELLEKLKRNQIRNLNKVSDNLNSEYSLLEKHMQSENIELITLKDSKHVDIKFLIKLRINLSRITPHIQYLLTYNDILLYITYNGSGFKRIIPELYLSKYLENYLISLNILHLPPFLETEHMIDYAEKIKKSVEKKVFNFIESAEKRKEFICTALVIQNLFVIEYDIISYRKISLLFEHYEYFYILNFDLPLTFPNEKFAISLCSVNNTEQEKPFIKSIFDFPYSSRWKPKQMIIKALEYIIENEIKTSEKELINS